MLFRCPLIKTTILLFLMLPSIFFAYNQDKNYNTYEFQKTMIIKSSDWKIHRLENLSPRQKGKEKVYIINENFGDSGADIDLNIDFEGPLDNLVNYRVIKSDFMFNKNISSTGRQAGKFYFSHNLISLLPYTTSIFSPGEVPGSFTIDFWLYLYKKFDNQYVIRYLGNNPSDESDKNTYGFSIFIEKGKLYYRFQNFFWSAQQQPISLSIDEQETLSLYKWEHHAITFNIRDGKIATFKNGIEQNVKWVTSDGRYRSSVYSPYIKAELSTPLIIGMNSFFSLDDLRITKKFQDRFELSRFLNKPGKLITGVYHFTKNKSFLRKIDFDYSLSQYSHIKTAYRISDKFFLDSNSDIPWVYIKNGLTSFPPQHDSGKYIQFKLEIYPHKDNTSEISINSIKLDFTEDRNPDAPILLTAVPGDGTVTVSWMPSAEADISKYMIYYGTDSQHYICSDALSGESPISLDSNQKGILRPITFVIRGLDNEKPYYISIRSFDKNGNYSDFSRELYARPSSVKNPYGYSIDR